jgi:hypothetical protein
MRNHRQLVGGFVIAVMMSAALLGTASPASADQGGPGGAGRSTCAFLQGILNKVGNADAAEALAAIFETVFLCDLE